MSETVASEIWTELKRYISSVDRAEAAETVVSILVDNDCDIEDIRSAFKGDSDIKLALTNYNSEDKNFDDEDLEEEFDIDDEDWEN